MIERPYPKLGVIGRVFVILVGLAFAFGSIIAVATDSWLAAATAFAIATACLSAAVSGRNAPVDPTTFRPEQRAKRENCPCCECPTIEWSGQPCLLCEWAEDPDASSDRGLNRARSNFRMHMTSYSPEELKTWGGTVPDAQQRAIKSQLIGAYAKLLASDTRAEMAVWKEVDQLEAKLLQLHRRVVSDRSEH